MPGDVPAGWERCRLGEVFRIQRQPVSVEPDRVYREIGIRSHGKGIFAKDPVPGKTLGEKQVFSVVPNALIANIVFAWEGAIARTTEAHRDRVVSHRFPMWLPDEARVDLDYVVYYFSTRTGIAHAAQSSPGGAGRNRTLNQTTFMRSVVPLPPLAEQTKIAAVLSSIDEAIQATNAVIEQTRRVKAGLLQDLLTRGVGHTRFKLTHIGEIPESWSATTLGALAGADGLQTGPFGSQLHASDYAEHGVPVAMPKDIVDGRLTDSSVARIPLSLAESDALSRHRMREGDIVFARRGDIGRSALVTADQVGWLCGTGCLRMRPSGAVHAPYLIHRLQHGASIRWLNENAVGQTMLNLNTTILRALPLSLPLLREQVEIAAHFEDADRSLSAAADTLDALRVVKAGLLQDLLTGRVRVAA